MFEIVFQSGEFSGENASRFLGLTSDTWGTGIISGLIVLLGFLLSRWQEASKDNKRKKRIKDLIVANLKVQLKSLDKFKKELQFFHEKLDEQTAHIDLTLSACQYFHTKIFKSIDIKDINDAYNDNERFMDLMDIYDAIDFLVERKPHKLRDDYLKALKAHLDSKVGESNHDILCITHLDYIKKTKKHILNNFVTIEQLKKSIPDFLAGKKVQDYDSINEEFEVKVNRLAQKEVEVC